MKEAKADEMFNKMKVGEVYRRADLLKYSSSVDRHLETLLKDNKVVRVSTGLYLKPKSSAFGLVPPENDRLVLTFLKDNRFLINSYSNYNQLGLGLTQLYNNQVVYNYKRHGEFNLGGKLFSFKRMPKFPKQLSKEFLLIDMFNNLKNLAEDQASVINNFFKLKRNFDSAKVMSLAKQFARPRTKKLLEQAYSK